MIGSTLGYVDVKLSGMSFIEMMKAKHVMGHNALALLGLAFEHGGYVAGGFATLFARALLLQRGAENFHALTKHLGTPLGGGRRFSSGYGDIDVWFPDEASLQSLRSDERYRAFIKQPYVQVSTSVTGLALEHVIDYEARVQLITGYLLPMCEQLSRFDIYNAMVGFNDRTLVHPERFCELESKKTLHVSQWNSPWTINRTFKYMQRKGYAALTDSTVTGLVNALLKVCETTDKSKLNDRNMLVMIARMDGKSAQKVLQPMLSSMNNEQLLKISAYFSCEHDYNGAMQEIFKRSKLPT